MKVFITFKTKEIKEKQLIGTTRFKFKEKFSTPGKIDYLIKTDTLVLL